MVWRRREGDRAEREEKVLALEELVEVLFEVLVETLGQLFDRRALLVSDECDDDLGDLFFGQRLHQTEAHRRFTFIEAVCLALRSVVSRAKALDKLAIVSIRRACPLCHMCVERDSLVGSL